MKLVLWVFTVVKPGWVWGGGAHAPPPKSGISFGDS
jgi:hypothetical protein